MYICYIILHAEKFYYNKLPWTMHHLMQQTRQNEGECPWHLKTEAFWLRETTPKENPGPPGWGLATTL